MNNIDLLTHKKMHPKKNLTNQLIFNNIENGGGKILCFSNLSHIAVPNFIVQHGFFYSPKPSIIHKPKTFIIHNSKFIIQTSNK